MFRNPLLEATGVAMIALDNELRIRFFTPHAKSIFPLLPTDIGRNISDLAPVSAAGDHLIVDSLAALNGQTPPVRQFEAKNGTCYMRRVQRYRAGRLGGTLVTFIEITEIKPMRQPLEWLDDAAAHILDAIRRPVFMVDDHLCLIFANEPFRRLFGLELSPTSSRHLALSNTNRDLLNKLLSHIRCDIDLIECDVELTGSRVVHLRGKRIRNSAKVLLEIDDIVETKRHRVTYTRSIDAHPRSVERKAANFHAVRTQNRSTEDASPSTLAEASAEPVSIQRNDNTPILASQPKSQACAAGSSSTTTVFVIDDDEGVREFMRQLFSAQGWSVRTYGSCEAFIADCHSEEHGCILLEARMPTMNGLDLLAWLRTHGHFIPALMVTGHGDIATAVAAMKAGAADFLEKPVHAGDLLKKVRLALAHTRNVYEIAATRKGAMERLSALSCREREILQMVLAGKASKNIAADLSISQRTVENHRSSIMKKSRARSLSELIRLVMIAGEDGSMAIDEMSRAHKT